MEEVTADCLFTDRDFTTIRRAAMLKADVVVEKKLKGTRYTKYSIRIENGKGFFNWQVDDKHSGMFKGSGTQISLDMRLEQFQEMIYYNLEVTPPDNEQLSIF